MKRFYSTLRLATLLSIALSALFLTSCKDEPKKELPTLPTQGSNYVVINGEQKPIVSVFRDTRFETQYKSTQIRLNLNEDQSEAIFFVAEGSQIDKGVINLASNYISRKMYWSFEYVRNNKVVASGTSDVDAPIPFNSGSLTFRRNFESGMVSILLKNGSMKSVVGNDNVSINIQYNSENDKAVDPINMPDVPTENMAIIDGKEYPLTGNLLQHDDKDNFDNLMLLMSNSNISDYSNMIQLGFFGGMPDEVTYNLSEFINAKWGWGVIVALNDSFTSIYSNRSDFSLFKSGILKLYREGNNIEVTIENGKYIDGEKGIFTLGKITERSLVLHYKGAIKQ